jgi:hypothetical protein
MSVVIGTSQSREVVGYEFRTGWFGKQILQVGYKAQDYDTNTGKEDGDSYIIWRDASPRQAWGYLNQRRI